MLPLHEDELISRVRARYVPVAKLGGCTTHSDKSLLNLALGGVLLVPRVATKDTSPDLEAVSEPMTENINSSQRTAGVCKMPLFLNL